MARNRWIFVSLVGAAIVAVIGFSVYRDEPDTAAASATASAEPLYWYDPMHPERHFDAPGKSPMGMDLVPVYEEAGEEKEPSSTIRIDPVTEQNMGVRLGRVEKKTRNGECC